MFKSKKIMSRVTCLNFIKYLVEFIQRIWKHYKTIWEVNKMKNYQILITNVK